MSGSRRRRSFRFFVPSLLSGLCALWLGESACHRDRDRDVDMDAGLTDLRPVRDLSVSVDAGDEADLSVVRDLSDSTDLMSIDLAVPRDLAALPDLAAPLDLSLPPFDFSTPPDLTLPPCDFSTQSDLSRPPDLATPPDLSVPPDRSTRPPCLRGTGWAAFRFKYSGSTSARVEALGLPDTSNFEAVPARATSFTDTLHGGGIEIASGNWILIRFSLVGLTTIRSATLSIYGRSYSTGSSGSFDAWSPLYGSIKSPTNSLSNAWPYSWSSVDYTSNVRIGDAPGLTGIRLYAGPSSNDLVINTVELCLDAS